VRSREWLVFGQVLVYPARMSSDIRIAPSILSADLGHLAREIADVEAAGADHLTVHGEACTDLRATLAAIRALGKRAGVALRPETPIDVLLALTGAIDLVLVLCVTPGQAGQAFMASQLPKMAAVRKMIDQSGQPIDLEVDGGISADNAALTVQAGANVLVSGSKIFDTPDRAATIAAFRAAAAAKA
jgi:ribulose-phosphate 3-epimerase